MTVPGGIQMADDTTKWVEAITKLTKLTQEETLKWSSTPSGGVLANDEGQQIESAFIAYYKDKTLRLYKKRFKVEDPNPLMTSMMIHPFHPKYPFWAAQIYLELIDNNGQNLWTFPEVSALRDLLTAVKYQASGVKDLLEDLVKDSAPE